MKALGALIFVLLLAGCQTGYFRLNQNENHDPAYYAALSRVVGQQINHR